MHEGKCGLKCSWRERLKIDVDSHGFGSKELTWYPSMQKKIEGG